MKGYVLGILCLSVTACMPGIPIPMPMPSAPTKAIPAADVSKAAPVTPREGAGAIVVTRDKQWRGRKCTHDISLDGQPVAGLRAGEQVTLYADPGMHSIVISIRGPESCQSASAVVPVRVVARTTTSIRIGADSKYDLKVESTSR